MNGKITSKMKIVSTMKTEFFEVYIQFTDKYNLLPREQKNNFYRERTRGRIF